MKFIVRLLCEQFTDSSFGDYFNLSKEQASWCPFKGISYEEAEILLLQKNIKYPTVRSIIEPVL
jgi:hypothetical protein